MTLSETFRYISALSLLTASAATKAISINRPESSGPKERFSEFYNRVIAADDSAKRQRIVDEYIATVKNTSRAVIEDSTVNFLYHGKAARVSVAGDLNGWDPATDTMKRIPRTNLFHLAMTLNHAARFEYKLVVDSTWILDPLNQQQAMGGYGANSEIWMPGYAPPPDIETRNVPHGTIDTIKLKSSILGRTHIGFVYLPPGYAASRDKFPSLYVTDGGEYLSLALMNNVLDNLIAEKRIEPIVAVFIDPRTDIRDAGTSMRMHDYTMSDSFVSFLVDEVRTRILKSYKVRKEASQTGIMGASLGGLIATYAAFTRPDVFGLAAAQSPSYWWNKGAMISMIEHEPTKEIAFYIDTGTMRDAQEHALKMEQTLNRKGYHRVKYGEYPEGHNWVNWRARLDDILEYFWGTKK